MTHCAGYRAAALARGRRGASRGLDAEPHGRCPTACCGSRPARGTAELAELRPRRPELHWDRLLFSAKECVYKAWFPLMGKMLDFSEAALRLDADGTFNARLLVPGPVVEGRRLSGFEGRWLVEDDLVATAITVLRS